MTIFKALMSTVNTKIENDKDIYCFIYSMDISIKKKPKCLNKIYPFPLLQF